MTTNQTEAAEIVAARTNRQVIPESLQLHGSDHPDLEQRYGGCKGPQLYQLQRAITSLSQGNATVGNYFTNLVKLWEELEVLMPTPRCTCNGCTCGASKAVADLASFTQLMQFLIGLGNDFDHIHGTLDWYKEMIEQPKKEQGVARGKLLVSWIVDTGATDFVPSIHNISVHLRDEPDHIPLPLPISKPISDDTLEIPTTPTMFPASSNHISPLPPSDPPPLPLRKPQRQSTKPAWMADYVCHCTSCASAHCTPSSFAPAHISFVAQLSSTQEPQTYLQASKDEK
ncbi:UNVERIFIED_CONTAM: hypothetical protein Sradi_3779400 [Sesamum radiatum]|uniref:Retrotransposon gag domain-containing protein n=1 Tax=Sesamum radiatum TaxID=300843 RepID=A0AAW2PZS5_SESRA